MSFELAQEVSTVFKGTSMPPETNITNLRCGQKSRRTNSIKKLPKTKRPRRTPQTNSMSNVDSLKQFL